MIQLRVHGRPAPKGSRIRGTTKDGRSFTRPASKYEKPWVDAVKQAAQIAMRHHEMLPPPYAIELEFVLSGPKKVSDRRYEWPTDSDLDKLDRAVIDGLVQGGVISDDRHVTRLTTSKRFCAPGEPSGVIAQIAQVQDVRLAA